MTPRPAPIVVVIERAIVLADDRGARVVEVEPPGAGIITIEHEPAGDRPRRIRRAARTLTVAAVTVLLIGLGLAWITSL